MLVALFVIGPLVLADRGQPRPRGWLAWLAYFGALGAGFMLIEVSVLQRFVLLLGHPVYSLTVTLFSLLLGTGLGAAWSRRFDGAVAPSHRRDRPCRGRSRRHRGHRRGDAGCRVGDSVVAERPDGGRGGAAGADGHRARDSDADRVCGS